MPIRLADLPLDRNGVQRAAVRLRDLRGRTTTLAGVTFIKGVSTKPVGGYQLRQLVANMGHCLEIYNEPEVPTEEPAAEMVEPTESPAVEVVEEKPKRRRRRSYLGEDD